MYNQNENHNDDRDFSENEPVYSTLFIISDKNTTKDDLEQVFSRFGHIEDIRTPHPRREKRICFIKFSKTSEAAKALEAMNLKLLPNSKYPLKVMVSDNCSEQNDKDLEKYKRLFLNIPRTMTEKALEDVFAKYGRLRSVTIQRDYYTRESKGFAYVSYRKFSEAAIAFEECERQYRAIFAKPKQERRSETSFESNISFRAGTSSSKTSQIPMMDNQSDDQHGSTRVFYTCCPQIQQWQIQKLFDLIPGMLECQFYVDFNSNIATGTVLYSNPTFAAYAAKKLNEFEYPPGIPMLVELENYNSEAQERLNDIPATISKLKDAIRNSTGAPDLGQLAEAIAEASNVFRMARGDVTNNITPDSNDLNYNCSVSLPPPQPLAHIDCPVVKRCFLICKGTPPPVTVLRDVFCRFGDLVDVYILPNRTVGFARYASETAAENAIKVLHGAEICDVRIKVVEAEAEAPPKKRRWDQ